MSGSPYCVRLRAATGRVGLRMMWLLFTINLLLGRVWSQPAGDEDLGKERDVRRLGLKAVVTACDKSYFESAENLVASVQVNEPDMAIFVYDLGLTADQRHIVSSWMQVTLISIDWIAFPSHVLQLKHCAWKPAVIKDAVERVGPVIYLDAGIELRWDLTTIKLDVIEHGHWLILEKTILGELVHVNQYDALGIERGIFNNRTSLAAGMIAISNLSTAWTRLFLPWHRCCMDPQCISPEGSNLSNHRYDQSALSVLFYKSMREGTTYSVMESSLFWASYSVLSKDAVEHLDLPTNAIPGMVFYCRRLRLPKPFSSLIRFKHEGLSIQDAKKPLAQRSMLPLANSMWSRIRPKFLSMTMKTNLQSLSQEQMQQALVELSFVEGAFMLQPHPSHTPDNLLLDFVVKFAVRLLNVLLQEAHPDQFMMAARIRNLIRRLGPRMFVQDKFEEDPFDSLLHLRLAWLESTFDLGSNDRLSDEPLPVKTHLTLQDSHYTKVNRYPVIYKTLRRNQHEFTHGNSLRILNFGASGGHEAFTLAEYFPHATIHGIETNENLVRTANAKAKQETRTRKRLHFFATTKTLIPSSYDLVTANSVLCRFPADSPIDASVFLDTIHELDQMLRVGGVMEIVNANYDFSKTELARQHYRKRCSEGYQALDWVPHYDLLSGLPVPLENRSHCNFFQKLSGLARTNMQKRYQIVTSSTEAEERSVVNLIASLQTHSPAHSDVLVVVAENAFPSSLVGICNLTFVSEPFPRGTQGNTQEIDLDEEEIATEHKKMPASLVSAFLALSTALQDNACAIWLHPSLEAQAPLHNLMHFLSGPNSPALLFTDDDDPAPLRCGVRGSKMHIAASKKLLAGCKGTSFENIIKNTRDCWERPECAPSLDEARLEHALCEIWKDQSNLVASEANIGAHIGSFIAGRPMKFGENVPRRTLFIVRTGDPPYHRARTCSHPTIDQKSCNGLGKVGGDGKRPICLVFVPLTLNLGDDIQTVAARDAVKNFTNVTCLVLRDRLLGYQDAAPTVVLFNGWFAHLSSIPPLGEWPPPDNLLAIPVSVHLSQNLRSRLSTHMADVAWFKEREPIGCRDWGTWEALTSAGIDAFFTGCLTTTFPKRVMRRDDHAHPFAVAVDFDLETRVPVKEVGGLQLDWYKVTHTLVQEDLLQTPKSRIDRASDYIQHLSQADRVWTTRLHAYLPSRAMGVPVVTDFSNAADLARFQGLDNITDEAIGSMRERLLSIIRKAVPVFTQPLPGDCDLDHLRRRLYKEWSLIAHESYPPDAFDGSARFKNPHPHDSVHRALHNKE